jgi:hypothetical protein
MNWTLKTFLNEMKGNETDDEFEYLKLYSNYDVFSLIIGVLICLLNGGEMCLIFFKPSLRTISNYFLASLAFADFLTGFVGIPLVYVCTYLTYGPACILSSIFIRFVSISTSLHILAVTGDKYIAIVHTMRYEHYLYRLYGKRTLFLLWILPLVSSVVQLSWLDLNASPFDEDDQSIVRINVVYHVICIMVFYVGPFVAMLYTYIKIFNEVRRQCELTKRLHPTSSNSKRKMLKRNTKERRAVIVFMITIVLYALFWLPYYAVVLQHHVGNELFDLPEWLEIILYNCRFFTSLLNPIFFTLGKHELHKTARQLLVRFFKTKSARLCANSRAMIKIPEPALPESCVYETMV